MFYNLQSSEQKNLYKNLLNVVGSLSNLFSESTIPYLYYRAAENVFCRAFEADNLSRSDVSADAAKQRIGIGLKTYTHGNGKTLQKVAEFNKDNALYSEKDVRDVVEIISKMRNERIDFTKRAHDLEDMIYHCVTRKENTFYIFEEPMYHVDLSSVRDIKKNQNSITFRDKHSEYSFYIPKSTLLKRFTHDKPEEIITVNVLPDPFEFLLSQDIKDSVMHKKKEEYVLLPLYSTKGERKVHQSSGLNQWNASGRPRDYNEVYIPIPSWIHRVFPGFFPSRDQPFVLLLPNRKEMDAKVCQQGSKALMSNPNKELGKWILRDVLKLQEGKLLTYEMLQTIGIDSVVIHKEAPGFYTINFAQIGSYDKFYDEHFEK